MLTTARAETAGVLPGPSETLAATAGQQTRAYDRRRRDAVRRQARETATKAREIRDSAARVREAARMAAAVQEAHGLRSSFAELPVPAAIVDGNGLVVAVNHTWTQCDGIGTT